MTTPTVGPDEARISYPRAFQRYAAQQPDAPAITCDGETVGRRDLDRQSNTLARALAATGATTGDLVAIYLPNSIDFVRTCLACWKLGATPLPMSARLPARELHALLEVARPALLVTDTTGAPTADAARSGLPVPQVVVGDPQHPYDQLPSDPLPDVVSPSWKANTSGGSTGRSKIIVSDVEATIAGSSRPNSGLPMGAAVVVPGPLHHSGPFHTALQAVVFANHLILMTRFDPNEFLGLIETHRAAWAVVVPTMMLRIWRLPEEERLAYDLSSLQVLLHSAAPCPPWLKEQWIQWLGPDRVFETYGGTEGYGSTWISGEEFLRHPGSVGRAAADSEAVIRDETGSPVPTGEVGLVYMRPRDPQAVTFHYVGAESTMNDRWLTIGDMGWMDEDGYVYLTDRRTDLIIAGGANVYPAEVEAALAEHPAVRSSAVIGLPDDDLGQRVHAIVQSPGFTDEAELRSFLADRLSSYKIPRQFEFVDIPLRDEWGKVRRFKLREERLAALAQPDPVGQEP